MIKQIPTIPKLLAMVIFALGSFAALLFLWLSFGGPVPFHPVGYRVNIQFPEAGQLTEQSDVRISGVNVGKVIRVYPNPNGPTSAEIELKARYAPIPAAARATLRSKTLLGETFVEIAPNRAAKGQALAEGGTIPVAAVAPTVELDELLLAFDKPTRDAFQVWMQSSEGALEGRGMDINAFFATLPQFTERFTDLSAIIDAQSSAVAKSISSTATVFDAFSKRQGDLRGLLTASDKTFGTIGQRNEDLAAIFQKLPAFERESKKLLPQVTDLADKADPVVVRFQRVANEMTPAFQAVQQMTPDLDRFMNRLGPVVTASMEGLPAFDRILQQFPPLLEDFGPFTRTINPLLDYLGKHRSTITAFFGNLTAATQIRQSLSDSDRKGADGMAHVLRVAAQITPQTMAFQPRAFGQTRTNAYIGPDGANNLPGNMKVLSSATCGNGDPAPPTESTYPGQVELLQTYPFRGVGRTVPRPACITQGFQPGFSTIFPQLTADPEIDAKGATR